MITSLVGYSLIWDSLDNRKSPTQGAYANFHQDVAGLGGDSSSCAKPSTARTTTRSPTT